MNQLQVLRFFADQVLKSKGLLDMPRTEQEAYLRSFAEPKDTIARSYAQYCSQFYFVSIWKCIILNSFSLIMIWIWLMRILFTRCNTQKSVDAVIDCKGWGATVVPRSLYQRFSSTVEVNWSEGSHIDSEDLKYMFQLALRYPFSGWFLWKIFVKIARYSFVIKQYSPKAIVVHNEYSFTSSVLTDFCRMKKVLHINYMHGEKLFNIRDSFFEYDEIYVWDEHYIRLFRDLRANICKYYIEKPSSILIDVDKNIRLDCYADVKYYPSIYTEEQIKQIAYMMQCIEKKGLSCSLRLHPRYSDVFLAKKYLRPEQIESADVTIEQSISNSKYIVGSYTTVLLQGYYSNRNVVIDDMIFASTFKMLKEKDYLLLSKSHKLLSEFIQC